METVKAISDADVSFLPPITLRHTAQRYAILRVLATVNHPLSAEEVLSMGRTLVPRLNRATVFRNLRALQDLGVVRRMLHPELGPLYERTGKEHHHHFHCLQCDRLFELPGCALDVRGSTPPGFRTELHEVFLYGRCPACSGGDRSHHP